MTSQCLSFFLIEGWLEIVCSLALRVRSTANVMTTGENAVGGGYENWVSHESNKNGSEEDVNRIRLTI